MRASLCSVLAASLWVTANAAPSAQFGALQECLDRLEYVDVPIDDIYLSCSNLDELILATGWADSLPDSWRDNFIGSDLEDLLYVISSYGQDKVARRQPDPLQLDTILAELTDIQDLSAVVSPWESLLDWMKAQLDRFFPGLWEVILDWLENFGLPEATSEKLGIAIVYLSGVIIVALLLALLIYTWKHRSFRSGNKPLVTRSTTEQQQAVEFSLEQLDTVSLGERPRWLLRGLLAELSTRQRLSDSAALTHRELKLAKPFAGQTELKAFNRVVGLSERATFGVWQPDNTEFSAVLDDGRLLLRSLEKMS